MTVREIIEAHLKSIGADGLCTEDCGCGGNDLFACDSGSLDCVPAMRIRCDTCPNPRPGCERIPGGGCYVPMEKP